MRLCQITCSPGICQKEKGAHTGRCWIVLSSQIAFRLNGQHIYLKKFAYDDRLVYNQNVLLGEGSSVLDSGTGTGGWPA